MKTKLPISILTILILSFLLISCEDFVEVDSPNNKLIRDEVFGSDETAISAMQGIYNELFVADFSGGYTRSVTFLSGLSADNIQNITTTNLERMAFEENELFPDNQNNLALWSSAYNIIYMANSYIEGIKNAENLSPDLISQLNGEAKFIRAFTYSYLVNLYGDVPLVLSTNYQDNELAPRVSASKIYEQIIDDLEIARESLTAEYRNADRTQVNKFAATALLARVYLYLKDWEKAEELSSQVIAEESLYELPDDLDEVFLANSREAIWQISPLGNGSIVTHTNEGNLFIIDPFFSFFAIAKLPESLLTDFRPEDKRLLKWIDYNPSRDAYFPYKYKIRNSSELPILENSMVLRLAEQFLIRSESRTELNDLPGATEDLDQIRTRAGLDPISEILPELSKEQLLKEIAQERKRELFSEWGHRWLDLKRTGRASTVLGNSNPTWEDTDVLYPIPAQERMKNPNLSQNPGY